MSGEADFGESGAGRRASAAARVCFIHIGMHKTGSTAIQQFMSDNSPALAEIGIFIPQSGRHGGGHHAVAWDVLGADPSTPASGTLEALIEEIRTSGLPLACISSEEFAHLYRIPNNMQRLNAGLRAIGYRPVIVAYLRPQGDQLEALYAEVGKHAPVRDFWECYREALNNGAVDLWHDNYFAAPLDYERHFLAPFRWIFGPKNVIVRPFRRDAAPHRIIHDFLRTIAGPSVQHERFTTLFAEVNARADFRRVVAAIAVNRPEIGAFVCPLEASGPFEILRPHEAVRLMWRFSRSNMLLYARTGVFVGCMSRARIVRLIRDFRGTTVRVRALRALFARDAVLDAPAERETSLAS